MSKKGQDKDQDKYPWRKDMKKKPKGAYKAPDEDDEDDVKTTTTTESLMQGFDDLGQKRFKQECQEIMHKLQNWNCPNCTFQNDAKNAKCGICQTDNPHLGPQQHHATTRRHQTNTSTTQERFGGRYGHGRFGRGRGTGRGGGGRGTGRGGSSNASTTNTSRPYHPIKSETSEQYTRGRGRATARGGITNTSRPYHPIKSERYEQYRRGRGRGKGRGRGRGGSSRTTNITTSNTSTTNTSRPFNITIKSERYEEYGGGGAPTGRGRGRGGPGLALLPTIEITDENAISYQPVPGRNWKCGECGMSNKPNEYKCGHCHQRPFTKKTRKQLKHNTIRIGADMNDVDNDEPFTLSQEKGRPRQEKKILSKTRRRSFHQMRACRMKNNEFDHLKPRCRTHNTSILLSEQLDIKDMANRWCNDCKKKLTTAFICTEDACMYALCRDCHFERRKFIQLQYEQQQKYEAQGKIDRAYKRERRLQKQSRHGIHADDEEDEEEEEEEDEEEQEQEQEQEEDMMVTAFAQDSDGDDQII